MIASITIGAGARTAKVSAVPLSAVVRSQTSPGGFAVFVTDGTGDTVKVHTRDVSLGETYGNMIAVTGGLSPADRVVTSGTNLIKDGQEVRVIP